jgi:phosphohistidine swiveling domain-containing protein
MWSKYITRRLAVQVAQAWNFGWGQSMQRVFRVSLLDTLVFRDKKKTEYYTDHFQHLAYIQGLFKLLKNREFLKTFHSQAKNKLEQILLSVRTRLCNKDLSILSNQQLLNIYQNFILPNQTQFYIRMWTVFNIAEPLGEVLVSELSKILPKDQINASMVTLSFPIQPNDVVNERIEILKIALNKRKYLDSELSRRLYKHYLRFRHIPMFDFDHEPYFLAHFQQQFNLIKNPKKELSALLSQFKTHNQLRQKFLKSIKINAYLKLLIRFTEENVFLRDYRDMLRQKLNMELNKLYREIGKRRGLDVAQVAVLTNSEIVSFLRSGRQFPRMEIMKRARAFLLIQKGSKVQMFSGSEAIKKAKKELGVGLIKKADSCQGLVGSPGLVRGRARIILTNRDLIKVKTGDIMIAAMTRQDYTTGMRLAKAIVTDEGGMVCHAAITARELGKPCVVGTKVATQIFKDGDLIEVDANKGVIKLLRVKQ